MTTPGFFCLSGVGRYDAEIRAEEGIRDLPGVPAEIRTMRQALESLGLTEHLPFSEDERPHDALERGLRRAVLPDAQTLVIYSTGHGALESTRYHLLLPDGMPFEPARLIAPLERWGGLREVVLIVDACSAEPGLDAAQAEMRRANTQTSRTGFWGIGASRRLETARQRSFATAFAATVTRDSRPSWTVSHLDPEAIANKINRALGPEQTVWLADGHPATPCQVLPNPRYQVPSRPSGLPIPADWATCARGVATPDQPGFFFTGRHAALHALREHLMSDGDPVAVVTGGPGSGKSALLGHLVLITDDDGRRALPGAVRLDWPALPVTIAAARGGPSRVTGTLTRKLGEARDVASLAGSTELTDLAEMLRLAHKPVGIVLDDLDEAAGPQPWAPFFDLVRSVPGVRVVVGLPRGSAIRVPGSPRVCDLADLDDSAGQDVRDYVGLQVRLAVPGAREEEIRRVADVLARHTGPEFEVAVALTGLPEPARGEPPAGDYLTEAIGAVDRAAHRVCRTRLAAALGDKAAPIVSALSALCSLDDAIALPEEEWAAAASAPDGPPVEAADVAAAARLMGSLAENRPTAGGAPRWRARFGHPGASGYPRPDVFLQRLPQVAYPGAADWRSADPSVLVLVAHAAGLGLIPVRLLDDPAFLLEAPAALVSKAIKQLRSDQAERSRRSRMWRLIPRDAPAADRALLLRIGAQRFDVKALVTALEAATRGAAAGDWQPAQAIDWVQPDRSRDTRVIQVAATAPGPHRRDHGTGRRLARLLGSVRRDQPPRSGFGAWHPAGRRDRGGRRVRRRRARADGAARYLARAVPGRRRAGTGTGTPAAATRRRGRNPPGPDPPGPAPERAGAARIRTGRVDRQAGRRYGAQARHDGRQGALGPCGRPDRGSRRLDRARIGPPAPAAAGRGAGPDRDAVPHPAAAAGGGGLPGRRPGADRGHHRRPAPARHYRRKCPGPGSPRLGGAGRGAQRFGGGRRRRIRRPVRLAGNPRPDRGGRSVAAPARRGSGCRRDVWGGQDARCARVRTAVHQAAEPEGASRRARGGPSWMRRPAGTG
jgi:hypothetical protein